MCDERHRCVCHNWDLLREIGEQTHALTSLFDRPMPYGQGGRDGKMRQKIIRYVTEQMHSPPTPSFASVEEEVKRLEPHGGWMTNMLQERHLGLAAIPSSWHELQEQMFDNDNDGLFDECFETILAAASTTLAMQMSVDASYVKDHAKAVLFDSQFIIIGNAKIWSDTRGIGAWCGHMKPHFKKLLKRAYFKEQGIKEPQKRKPGLPKPNMILYEPTELELLQEIAFDDNRAADRVVQNERADILGRALGQLERIDPEQHAAVTLKYVGDLTFRQVGDVLGHEENVAISKVRGGLIKLRGIIEATWSDNEIDDY